MTPGTQPQKVNNNTIRKEPQPFPITAKGGKIMASNTRIKLMVVGFLIDVFIGRKIGDFVTA